jgi:hypothetical protein
LSYFRHPTNRDQRSSFVDIDSDLIIDRATGQLRKPILTQLDLIAKTTTADLFLLVPKQPDIESASFNGNLDMTMDSRLRCAIFADMETMEHAKTRVLIMIDQIVCLSAPLFPAIANVLPFQLNRCVDSMKLELSMHTLICGRGRKNIKVIESATGTAIYFPPPFPRLFGYTPNGATRRPDDLIYITGKTTDDIMRAKHRLHDLVMSTKVFVKSVMVTDTKLDAILLERLDKVRKIIENNGSYILLPPLGVQPGHIRVQGTDVLHVERTVRDLMALVSHLKVLRLLHGILIVYRPVNSIVLRGSLPTLTKISGLLPPPTFVQCYLISASILVLSSTLKNSISTSLVPTMLSRPP